MRTWAILGVAASALLLATAGPALAGTIDTTGSWNGTQYVHPFGETNTATYGQTFTVGADNVLTDFTFWLDDQLNSDYVDFSGYVMAWDGTKATGSILYQSGMLTTTNDGGTGGMEQFTFSTGALALTAGSQYVAFLSASNYFDGFVGTANMGWTSTNAYSGGAFVYMNNGSNFGLLTSNSWPLSWGGDAAFTANFVAVPLPPSAFMGLALLGGLGLAQVVRKRRQGALA